MTDIIEVNDNLDTIKCPYNKDAIKVTCPRCGKTFIVFVDLGGIEKYENGMPIQDAFPTTSTDAREMLLSGFCPNCWEDVFGETFE